MLIQPDAKEVRLDFSEEVAILMGESATRVTVHKDVLTSSSGFFRAACGGSWKESKEKSISLPETTEEIFMIYVGWLYTGNAEVYDEDEHQDLPKASETVRSDVFDIGFDNIVDSYILGDFLDDESFCNALIDNLMLLSLFTKTLPDRASIGKYWAQLPQGSGIRRLLVDLEVSYGETDCLSSDNRHWPYDYLIELVKAYGTDRGTDGKARQPEEREKCYYHRHSEGSPKCACGFTNPTAGPQGRNE